MIGYEKHKLFDDEAAELQPSEWWRKRRHRSRQKKTMGSFAPALGTLPTLALIANHEYLLWVFDLMKQRGGQAPGLDGLRYGDFSRSEIAAALREIARATRDGTYRPHPYRSVLIPKEDGTSRELHLRNIIDRVVAGALYRALVPYFEPRLSGYGFRAAPEMWTAEGEPLERYNTWRLLADLELAITEEQRFVLAIDDVKKAFDNVNIDLVLAILAKHIQEAALLRLIEVVLRGGDDNHNIGIDQGSPLSPIILNILLTEAHDEPLSKEVDSPSQYRYADNLTYLSKTIEEAIQTLKRVKDLLNQADLTLKGKDGPPVDLREGEAQLLGFTVSIKKGKVHFDLGSKAWAKLAQDLRKAQEARDPTNVTRQVMVGFVQAYGPALGNLDQTDTLDRVLQTAADFGFHEGITFEELEKAWESARSRWKAIRTEARQRYKAKARSAGTARAAPPAASSAAATLPGAAPNAGGPAPQESLGDGAPPSASSSSSLPQAHASGGSTNASSIDCVSTKVPPGGPDAESGLIPPPASWGHLPSRVQAGAPPTARCAAGSVPPEALSPWYPRRPPPAGRAEGRAQSPGQPRGPPR